jgi:glycine/D-amino acid oxidase-like deaminating enzyme
LEKDRIGAGSSSRAAGITTGLLRTETGIRVRKKSVELFPHFTDELEGYTYHNEQGCLNLFTPESWPQREALLGTYDRWAVPYDVIGAAAIRKRWPLLQPEPDWIGLHDPEGGYSEPEQFLHGLAQKTRQLGVEILEGHCVDGFHEKNGRVRGVTARARTLEADAVVCTTHVWSLPVFKSLNIQFPIKNFVHQRYLSQPFSSPVSLPPINADMLQGYIRPAAGGRLLLGVESSDRPEMPVYSTDFSMNEVTAPAELREVGYQNFCPLLPILSQSKWESEEVGLLCFSSDGEPILGSVADMPGLFVGCAFHSGGFSYSPAAGFYLAEWVAEGNPSLDLRAFSPNRFQKQDVHDFLSSSLTQAQTIRRRH